MDSPASNKSFEALIHADRARKRNEDLANTIFGRSKSSQNIKKSQNGSQGQKEARSPSLASRMGVQKRHSSSSTVSQKNPFNPPSRPSSTTPSSRNAPAHSARATRLINEIDNGNANVSAFSRNSIQKSGRNGSSQPQSQAQAGPGLSIKGSAGPFTIHASNFAPGTTEADIESALHSDLFDAGGHNCLLSCSLVGTRPAVVFEMVFTEKSVADRIINKFNNLKADGRVLKVEFAKSSADTNSNNAARRSTTLSNVATPSVEPAIVEDIVVGPVEGDMDVEEADPGTDFGTTSYDHDREAADRDRRDRDRNRDGFGSNPRREEGRDERPREDRDRRRDDRDVDRNRDRDRDREREDRGDRGDRDRDREREREHGRDRDRDFERRDPQSAQPYNNPEYSQRPPGPAYGNGFNRPPRGGSGYGGFNRGGYGYPRGGGSGYGPRGAYRGGYSR